LITRISLLDKKLQADEMFVRKFGDRLQIFGSFRTLYLALHLALSGKRWLALGNLLYTLRAYPYVILNYRFAVVLKKILLW
jgi:hypothetical protein